MPCRPPPTSARRTDRIGSARGALLAAALGGLAGCSSAAEPVGGLAVADVRQPATSLFHVARQSGCLAAEGLALDVRTFDLGRDALATLREGTTQVAIVYETPLLRAAFEDDRLRVLTSLHTSTRNTRLVARRDRKVTDFSDLAGRRIGVARGTNADFFVDLVLRFAGVPRSKVTIVDLAPEDSVAALARGDLDAAVLSDPPAADAERALGDGARVLRTELYAEVSLLVTRADVVASHERELTALLRGLACGEREIRRDPEAALDLLRTRFGDRDGAALRAQLARVSRGLGLDNVLVQVLRAESAWLRDSALARGSPPDLERLLDPRLLDATDPEAVMLLLPHRGAP